VGRGSQNGVEFIQCQPALREVLPHCRGSRVPVSIAHADLWRRSREVLPGHLGQLPQLGGVVIQRGPAVAGEDCGCLRSAAAGAYRPHVSGFAELAQQGGQAAG
jgi:hypothetical protein